MNPNQPNEKINQKAKAGRNAQQIGGNYTNTSNINLWIPIIGLLVLGGIAGAVVFGMNQGGQTPQLEQQRSPLNPAPTTP